MTELDRAFESLAKEFLAAHPEVGHEWREVRSRRDGDRTDLICGPGAANEVFASLLGYQIALGLTKGEHQDFESFGRGITNEQVAKEAFERFAALLDEHGHLATTH